MLKDLKFGELGFGLRFAVVSCKRIVESYVSFV